MVSRRGRLVAGLAAGMGLATFAMAARAATPTLAGVEANARSIPRYEKFELTFQARGDWKNPFDPAEVAIDCRIEPPQGEPFLVPAFYYRRFRRDEIDGRERLTPVGEPCWKVRIAPTQVGTYRCRLQLRAAGQTVESDAGAFEATAASNARGFVRISPHNPRYLERDDGSTFLVVGEDMLFPGGAGTYAMDKWLTSLARAGGNFIRTWWCHAGMNLESRASEQPARHFGVYDLASAWRADHELALAERLGVEVMPTIETQQYLRRGVWWEAFTYNQANGGPLARPGDYFTDARAAQAFRNRLRYIVARWSYSTAIFSWQFWNEVDTCNDYDPAAVAAWHRAMSRYLRGLDPNRHIISTNYGNLDGRTEVDDLPETELISTNLYTRHDTAESSLWAARFMSARRAKPYLLSEFGLGHHDRWAQNDPTGIALHDGLWGAAFGGAAGGALVWEWNDWVDPQNLYHHFTPFAAAMQDVPFAQHEWRPVEFGDFDFRDKTRPPYFAGVFFEGFSTNYQFNTCPQPRPAIFTVTPDGGVDRPDCFSGVLAPVGAAKFMTGNRARNDAAVATDDSRRELRIDMPRDGELVLHVPRFSGEQHAILEVTIDGHVAFHRALVRESADAPWDYFAQFRFPLPAGPHRVTVANLQPATPANIWSDRVTVAYELTNFRLRHGPNLDCAGLQSDACLLLWLRNPEFTWLFAREGRKAEPQPEGMLHLRRVPDGRYTVVWRDTWTGDIIGRDTADAEAGDLTLHTPAIDKGAVARLSPIGF
ncbi:MAG TPA: DUF5060 domain-containing protein [Opitutus sp.]|nr:DUF5060 domain-containing protein [Opitutus sp.]